MKKTLVLLLIAFFASNTLWAQQEEGEQKQGFQKDKFFLAGNFGLTFGDYTLINVSPQLGYHISNRFAAGIGLNGQYVSMKERDYNDNVVSKSTRGVAGLNAFGRFYPVRVIMLQVQPEANYVFGKDKYYDSNPAQVYKADAVISPSLLAGGGLVLPVGRGGFVFSIMYDVLQNKNSPYGKRPVYNVGYSTGF